MSFPKEHRAKLHSTDEIDKGFVAVCGGSYVKRGAASAPQSGW
jgi:hypothetical protein